MAIEFRDRLEIIRALYSIRNAVALMHTVNKSGNTVADESVSNMLGVADESITLLLNRLEGDLDDKSSS